MRLRPLLFAALLCAVLPSCSGHAGAPVPIAARPDQSPAPTPTAGPTPTPGPETPYAFAGCDVYPQNDWFTADLLDDQSSYVSNTVDPNGAAIIDNLNKSRACGGSCALTINAATSSVTISNTPANVAASTTPLYVVQGCSTACADDGYGDNPTKATPWQSGFLMQGSCATGTYWGDCHTVVMTPPSGDPAGANPCVDYETYSYKPSNGSPFDGTAFTAKSLATYNLSQPYQPSGAGVTASQLPMLGTVDLGEDAALPSIDHIAHLTIPGSDGSPVATGGYVAPATGGGPCRSSCKYTLPMGARLRLNASKYTCPSASTNPQASLICVQLETYGAIVADHSGATGTFRVWIALTSAGTNPWRSSDINAISTSAGHGIPLGDFDVMTLGPLNNCPGCGP